MTSKRIGTCKAIYAAGRRKTCRGGFGSAAAPSAKK